MSDLNGSIAESSNDLAFFQPSIELDWERYFQEFCNAHGKYPVVYGDKELLLFCDGWMYSSTSYEGPEYPPPTDKKLLNELQLYYWKRRSKIVKRELDALTNMLSQIRDATLSRSLPLYQRTEYRGDDGKLVVGSDRIDLTVINKRMDWLKNDLENCKIWIARYKYIPKS